jgi:hypothetical protein
LEGLREGGQLQGDPGGLGAAERGHLDDGRPVVVIAAGTHPHAAALQQQRGGEPGDGGQRSGERPLVARLGRDLEGGPLLVPLEGDGAHAVGQLPGLARHQVEAEDVAVLLPHLLHVAGVELVDVLRDA